MFKVGRKIIDLQKPDILRITANDGRENISLVSELMGQGSICPASILKISVNWGKSVLWVNGQIIKNIA